ncbi:MAG: hypothetical protein QOI39_3307 [Mycobacterium sp.]|nr:hypothetical protein [Mycobacterium sp.]
MKVFCGIDWAENHHDVALVDEHGQLVAKCHIGDLTFITAADPPIGQACDLRVHAHPPPILRTSGWAICTPGRLESARSAVSMSDPNTNPTVSGFPNMLLCNIFRIIARPAQSAFSEHIGQYPRAAMRPAEIYRRGAHQFDKSQVLRHPLAVSGSPIFDRGRLPRQRAASQSRCRCAPGAQWANEVKTALTSR